MFLAKRTNLYELHNKKYEIEEVKNFFDQEFIPIIDRISKKGLVLTFPAILDGWDASFVYKKLKEWNWNSPAKKNFELFLYMRLDNKTSIFIEHRGFFNNH